jgi:signal transduction histidine kinase
MTITSRRIWWFIYGVCATAVIAALAWVTAEMIRLERAELQARADAAQQATHQENLRLALWRMESWFVARLAREAARPHYAYQPFYAPERAYTDLLAEVDEDRVLAPSPLLTYESDLFLLHFQIEPDGRITSPQVPEGNLRDLAQGNEFTPDRIARQDEWTQRLRIVRTSLGDTSMLVSAVAEAEARTCAIMEVPSEPITVPPQAQARGNEQLEKQQILRSKLEQGKRALNSNWAQQVAPQQSAQSDGPSAEPVGAPSGVEVGMFAPVLLPVDDDGMCSAADLDSGSCVMLLVRRVQDGFLSSFQGILLHWPALRDGLIGEIADLLPEARLRLVDDGAESADAAGLAMASLPIAIDAPDPAPIAVTAGFTTMKATLLLVWGAMLIAIAAAGITLHASIVYGEKRGRFASAVTHELRTPLTTFRMYSEMLAEGMVRDESQRQAYLETLRSESDRLATLVENVLAYARLERGRMTIDRRRIRVRELIDGVLPRLRRRAEAGEMTLVVEDVVEGALHDAEVVADAEAVGQILFNLVDNACKYAGAAEDRRIHLAAGRADGRVQLEVRDHGPGIAPEHAGAVFQPFERGDRSPGDTTPGVGLGLALSRGLARSLQGDLRVVPNGEGGARFRLTLPRAS